MDRVDFLTEEIELLKLQIQPRATGHIHTTISVLARQLEGAMEERLIANDTLSSLPRRSF